MSSFISWISGDREFVAFSKLGSGGDLSTMFCRPYPTPYPPTSRASTSWRESPSMRVSTGGPGWMGDACAAEVFEDMPDERYRDEIVERKDMLRAIAISSSRYKMGGPGWTCPEKKSR